MALVTEPSIISCNNKKVSSFAYNFGGDIPRVIVVGGVQVYGSQYLFDPSSIPNSGATRKFKSLIFSAVFSPFVFSSGSSPDNYVGDGGLIISSPSTGMQQYIPTKPAYLDTVQPEQQPQYYVSGCIPILANDGRVLFTKAYSGNSATMSGYINITLTEEEIPPYTNFGYNSNPNV